VLHRPLHDIQVSASPQGDGYIVLEDGRRLGYAEWGNRRGPAVFLFHGRPGSRLVCPDVTATLRTRVRLISVDRPGYGRSDPDPGRTLSDTPDDVVALADRLGIGVFAVAGWSSGGPHALACGALAPERVSAVGVMNSEAPYDRVPDGVLDPAVAQLVSEVRADPYGMVGELFARYQWYADDPDEMVRRLLGPVGSPEPVPGMRAAFTTCFREGARHGATGCVEDFIAESLPWGFDLEEVQVPAHLWSGRRDPLVHPAHAEILRTGLGIRSVDCPDCDHNLPVWHWEEILHTLTAALRG
jgi:pimeloyl-ACP methyl ester carboxylesterase